MSRKEASAHGVKTMRGRNRRTWTWPLDSHSLHPPGPSRGAPGHVPHPVILSWTTHTESLGGGRAGWRDGLSPYHSATPKPASAPPTKHRPLLSRPLRPQTRPFCQRPVAEAGSTGGGAGCGWLAFVSGESWEGLGGSCREHIHITFSAAT